MVTPKFHNQATPDRQTAGQTGTTVALRAIRNRPGRRSARSTRHRHDRTLRESHRLALNEPTRVSVSWPGDCFSHVWFRLGAAFSCRVVPCRVRPTLLVPGVDSTPGGCPTLEASKRDDDGNVTLLPHPLKTLATARPPWSLAPRP